MDLNCVPPRKRVRRRRYDHKRLGIICASNDGHDGSYADILDKHFGRTSPDGLHELTRILGKIVCAGEPPRAVARPH